MIAWGLLLPAVLLGAAHPDAVHEAVRLLAQGEGSAAAARLGSAIARLGPALLAAVYAIPHALWAVRRIRRRAAEAAASLAAVQLDTGGAVTVTRGIGSVVGPTAVAITLGTAAAAAVVSWRGAAHGLLAPILAVILLPQATLLWVYLSLTVGLFRLGSHRLALEQYAGDSSLGLRPVGRLAFAGFGSFVANFAPLGLLSIGGRSGVDLIIVSAFLLLGTFAVFGSLLRVRSQMTQAKRRQVARARALYAAAYEPLRSSPTLDVLQRQAPLLSAAEALERRADAIQTWPFTNALLARAVVIATSVLAGVLGRLAQRALGV
jgi:hypothetical protein